MGMRKVNIRYYARDNIGASYHAEDLDYVAGLVKEIFEDSETFSEVKKKIEQNEDIQKWLSKWGRGIECGEWYVKISDKLLDESGNSWGYEYAEIFLDDTFERLESDRKKILEWIENIGTEEFTVIVNSSNYAVKYGFEYSIEEKGKLLPDGVCYTITKEKLVECIKNFFDYLENDFSDNGTPPEQAVPICCNNPYAWDEPNWKVELYKNKIVLSTKYQDLLGAHYHSFEERAEIYPIYKGGE